MKFKEGGFCNVEKSIRSRKVLGLAFRRSLWTFGEKNFNRERDEKARLQPVKMRTLQPVEHPLDEKERGGGVREPASNGCKRVSS